MPRPSPAKPASLKAWTIIDGRSAAVACCPAANPRGGLCTTISAFWRYRALSGKNGGTSEPVVNSLISLVLVIKSGPVALSSRG